MSGMYFALALYRAMHPRASQGIPGAAQYSSVECREFSHPQSMVTATTTDRNALYSHHISDTMMVQ